jgi:hypothetical protein
MVLLLLRGVIVQESQEMRPIEIYFAFLIWDIIVSIYMNFATKYIYHAPKENLW